MNITRLLTTSDAMAGFKIIAPMLVIFYMRVWAGGSSKVFHVCEGWR